MPMSSPAAQSPPRLRAFLFLFTNIFFWSIGPLFIKYFSLYYDVWTQNAFRYSSAAAMLLAFMVWRREPLFRLSRAQWGKLLIVSGVNILLQTVYAKAFYFVYPSVASLVIRIDIPIICLLSFFFFHDERPILRSPWFLSGTALALPGLFFVIWGRDPELLARLSVGGRDFWMGVGLMVVYAFCLATYNLSIKRLVRDVHPFVSFTHVSWTTSVGLIVLMLIFGRPASLWQGPPGPILWMLATALCCVMVAHTALYAALREIKAVMATALMLLTPVLTCVFSAVVYGDRLSTKQYAGGAAVLAGAWLAALAQARLHRNGRNGPAV